MIADLDPAASVYVEMSSTATARDGYRRGIPSATWQLLTFLVCAPTWYDSLAITIRKESDGLAVLARLEVESGDGCAGAHPAGQSPVGRLVRGRHRVHVRRLRPLEGVLADPRRL